MLGFFGTVYFFSWPWTLTLNPPTRDVPDHSLLWWFLGWCCGHVHVEPLVQPCLRSPDKVVRPEEASPCLCGEQTSFVNTHLCQAHAMLNQVSAWHHYHVPGLSHAGYSMDTLLWCLHVDAASWSKSGAKQLTQLDILTHSLVLWLVGHTFLLPKIRLFLVFLQGSQPKLIQVKIKNPTAICGLWVTSRPKLIRLSVFVLHYFLLKTHSFIYFFFLSLSSICLFVALFLSLLTQYWLRLISTVPSSNRSLQEWHCRAVDIFRWNWQPACPSHIWKDRAGLVSSRCCLHQKLCRVSNLWFHTCGNNCVECFKEDVWTLAI